MAALRAAPGRSARAASHEVRAKGGVEAATSTGNGVTELTWRHCAVQVVVHGLQDPRTPALLLPSSRWTQRYIRQHR